MGKIVFFATSENMHDVMTEFIATLEDSSGTSVVTAHLDNAIYIARGLNPKEVDAIIVRGNTASILAKSQLPFPVIPIVVGNQEIAEAFQEAKKLSAKTTPLIGLSGFEQSVSNIKALLSLSGVEIQFYHIGGISDVEKSVNAAIRDNVDVMISGKVCTELCRAKGLPAVEMKAGLPSIQLAYSQALEFQKTTIHQKSLADEELVLARHSNEALIAIDEYGFLLTASTKASEFLNIPYDMVQGYSITQFRALDRLGMEGIRALAEQRSVAVAKVNNREYAISAQNADLARKKNCFVLTVVSVTELQRNERAVRRALKLGDTSPGMSLNDLHSTGLYPRAVLKTAKVYADSTHPALLISEAGCGRGYLVSCIHKSGARDKNELVSFDCRRFVHMSLTEAEKQLYELFLRAHNGTLHLKYINETPPIIQELMFALILEPVVKPSENIKPIPVDVSLIASADSSQNLSPKLKFMFAGYTTVLPPLREHINDLHQISIFFMAMSGIVRVLHEDVLAEMQRYSWRGNLNGLYSFLCRWGEQKHMSHSQIKRLLHQCNVDDSEPETHQEAPSALVNKQVLKADRIRNALDKHSGNKTLAAQELGISRTTLWKILRKENIIED